MSASPARAASLARRLRERACLARRSRRTVRAACGTGAPPQTSPPQTRAPRTCMATHDRFLTTHIGSLPRSEELIQIMFAREDGIALDQVALERKFVEAVERVV